MNMQIPASYHKERIWFMDRFERETFNNNGCVYHNIPLLMEINGPLNVEILEKSICQVLKRHEVLRTKIELYEDSIYQKIEEYFEFKLEHMDIPKDKSDDISGFALELNRHAFDEGIDGFLFKAILLKESDVHHVLVITIHHLICDKATKEIIMNELLTFYDAFARSLKAEMEELPLQYADFSDWQKNLPEELVENLLMYWKRKLNGKLQALEIPIAHKRAAIHIYNDESLKFEFSSHIYKKAKEFCSLNNKAVGDVLLAAYVVLLSKYSKLEEIVVGTSMDNRIQDEMKGIAGPIANLVALRNHIDQGMSFLQVVDEVSVNYSEAEQYQSMSFDKLVMELNIEKDMSRTALFDMLFQYEEVKELGFNGECCFKEIENNLGWGKYDLNLLIQDKCGALFGIMVYNGKYYDASMVKRMTDHFLMLLTNLLDNPMDEIKNVSLLGEAEKNTLLHDWNNTHVYYPKEACIHTLFMEQVNRTPDNIAIVFGSKCLTYSELDIKSNQLARRLVSNGVKPQSFVGIMLERSLEMIVGILGILKAGAAYLPLDKDYPADRISYMLEDSGANILLTKGETRSGGGFAGNVINLEDQSIYSEDSSVVDADVSSKSLAYVIYTSGSTGKPKGVMLEHQSVHNFIKGITDIISFEQGKSILALTTISFDIFVLETLLSLTKGLKVFIADENQQIDTKALSDVIRKNSIDMLQMTPSRIKLLLNNDEASACLENIKEIMIGGEALPESLLREIKTKTNARIYNMYGPTETTVWSTVKELTHRETIDIGKPIANTQIYILDSSLNLQPVGVAGELCIGGDGLARGYLNREELTKEKFIPNPFKEGERIYKTGDLARWMPDGNIEYIGRMDHQVKLRGYRIELGEIESRIIDCEGVKEAVVLVKDDENDNVLVAFVVAQKELSAKEIRKQLAKDLPEYMIPSLYVQVDKIPLNQNGKIDRKVLLSNIKVLETETVYIPPADEIEEKLCRIWAETLGIENIGTNYNFFELGGHSLKATILRTKIHKAFGCLLQMSDLFTNSTISSQAELIKQAGKIKFDVIEPVGKKEYYDLSKIQEQLWSSFELGQDNGVLNIPVAVILKNLDAGVFEEALYEMLERHESLRTTFVNVSGSPKQKILEYDKNLLKIRHIDLRGVENRDKEAEKLVEEETTIPFDLHKDILVRVKFVHLEYNKHLLVFTMHHIISDVWSINILLNEIGVIYNAFKEGKENPLRPLRIQYKDYAAWYNDILKGEEAQKHRAYWNNVLAEPVPVINLPTDYKRPMVKTFSGKSISFDFDKETKDALIVLGHKNGASLFMVLMTSFYSLMHFYTGDEDIIIGTPIAGREHVDLQNQVGFYVNTLPLRVNISKGDSFNSLLEKVKAATLGAYEHQALPFDEIIELSGTQRDLSHSPLFDVMVQLINVNSGSSQTEEFRGVDIEEYNLSSIQSKYDIVVHFSDNGEIITTTFQYNVDLFKYETIVTMIERYRRLVRSILVESPEVLLNKIELMAPEEKHRILFELNDTKADYPKDKVIHQLFDEQALKVPDNIAVKYRNRMMTYRELKDKTDSLAVLLRGKGVKPNDIVSMLLERSEFMIVAMLAILKSGGAYLPIAADYPDERIRFLLKDSNSRVVLTTSDLKAKLAFEGDIICIDEIDLDTRDGSVENVNSSGDLAYIIYTSGTTGNPKGVMIEHRNVVRLMTNDKFQFDFSDKDIWTMFHSYNFDFSVWEMYGALLYGGKLIIVPAMLAKDNRGFHELLIKEKVTVLNQTPQAFYNLINEELANPASDMKVRYIIFGGEALSPQKLKGWRERYKEAKLINMYGITETTVHVTYKEISDYEIDNNRSNIGRAIPTLTTYIMDGNMKLLPPGVAGELCVGGEGVARGYLNRKELTAEKFVKNPYKPDEIIYRSGDLVKLLPDGDMEYLGRIDHQVKIRGFRIELGEIENRIIKCENVKETVVLVKETENDKVLVAFIAADKNMVVKELRERLLRDLPDYMIPSAFVQVDKIPLNQNGKVDRKALLSYTTTIDTGTDYIEPSNKQEEKLLSIWKDILGVQRISTNDNFFELGGHSLKATILKSKIHKDFNCLLSLAEIFANPTIKKQAELIEGMEQKKFFAISQVEQNEYYDLSKAQKRLWTVVKLGGDNGVLNIPLVVILKNLDAAILEKALVEIIKRHESLRTIFISVEGDPKQKVLEYEKAPLNIKYIDSRDWKDNEVDRLVAEEIGIPFDIEKGPLVRVTCLHIGQNKHLLIFTMHHIISDAWSSDVLLNEIGTIYKAYKEGKKNPLEPLKIQYKDYAKWHNGILTGEEAGKYQAYWRSMLAGPIPVISLPTDYQRPKLKNLNGRSVQFFLDKETKDSLIDLGTRSGASIFMVLMASFYSLMYHYTGQEDFIIGTPIAGREHIDLQEQVGFYLNILPLRVKMCGKDSFTSVLEKVKQTTLGAYENQIYPFDEMVEEFVPYRDMSRSPLFDVMVQLINVSSGVSETREFGGVEIEEYRRESLQSKYDIVVNFYEEAEGLNVILEYSVDLFKHETILRMVDRYKMLVKNILKDDKQQIAALEINKKRTSYKISPVTRIKG